MPDTASSARFLVTIRYGGRRERRVVVEGACSEYEAAALAQKQHCRPGETAILAYQLRSRASK